MAAPSPPIPIVPGKVARIEGFSTAMKVGSTVYISGQVALDSLGGLVGGTDLSAQAVQALANLATVVRSAQGVPADVVKLTFYVVHWTPSDLKILQDASAAWFPATSAPAVTIVGVTTLPREDLLVAVDGVAMLRGELPDRTRDHRQ
ncbi:MAG: RidA family protein [Gemmatimonadota bacterium]